MVLHLFHGTTAATAAATSFVKIIYAGGRVELYDRPVLASDIMSQHPKCCVTHPDVFHQPWAVLSPDALLSLGHKFYVVPVSTVRKLRRHHLNKNSGRTAPPQQSAPSAADPSPSSRVKKNLFSQGSLLLSLRRPFQCLRKSRKKGHNKTKAEGGPRKNKSPQRTGSESPGTTSSHHWKPNLDSITEE
ncbi:hypothetical protein ZIOFF_055777 [Zingiber officinale]|uniref:Uncharacterized protein n=1 Tax=Zingiber officinale TaxID=94328 RepID=A0A8J5FFI8_ZINOF|nr:hypothetical protein ZIOFF_055777 [Zingiber officinale]